jgi:hypothetical protein
MPDREDQLNAALAELRFSVKWLEYGLLDEQFLVDLFDRYQHSDDHHTEHYRYAAFRAVLEGRQSMDDLLIDRYIELAEIDEDQAMAASALYGLLVWSGLTQQQYQRLCALPVYTAPVFQKIITRRRMIEEIHSAKEITSEDMDRYIASRDTAVQEALLFKPNISRQHLEVLRERGTSRRIRNMAKNELRRVR